MKKGGWQIELIEPALACCFESSAKVGAPKASYIYMLVTC